MKLLSCTTTAPNRRKLEIELDAASFAAACEAAYKKNVSKINIPGFRKGKVPRNVVERMYGKEFFFEDAVNALYPEALEAAIKEAALEYVDDAIDLDVTKISLEEGVVFTAEITVKPEVKLPKYEGIEVERPLVNVTDEQVDERIRQLRERNARVIDVDDRAAKEGDTCVFDFEGFVDGVAFDGGKAESYELVLGSGNFIPGFEDQMVGHSVGEEFDVNVTFPEEYHATELAGKPAVFKIKMHNIKETQLPELDDDFVTEVSEDCDTVEQLRESIRKELTEAAEKKAEDTVVDRIYDWIDEEMECDLPDAMVERRIDASMRDFDVRLRGQGITLQQYCQYIGMTMEQMRAQSRPNATRQVRIRLALEYIVKAAGINISDEEVDAEIAKMAEQYKMTAEAVRAAIDVEDLRSDIACGKAADLVREKAIVTDEKPE
ncbi:MAG: trigger factor [Ruminococcaceae bacterium]|nr:trigger factor [Oscillospiraceae bacterium]